MLSVFHKSSIKRLGLHSAVAAPACLSSVSELSETLWKEQREERERHDGWEELNSRRYREKANSQARKGSRNREDFAQRFDIGLIGRLGREKRWEEALIAFEAVEGKPSETLGASIVDALAKNGKLQLAQHFFDKMPQKTVPAYNSLITLMGRIGRLEEVEALVHNMCRDCLALNDVTYGSVIAACGRVGNVQAALHNFEEMIAAGIAPNAVSCAAALSACARAGDRQRAVELLERMRSWNIQPNIGHFTSVITSCAKDGDDVLAMEMFKALRAQSIRPDIVAYTSLVGCFAGEDALSKAEMIRLKMHKDGIAPNAFFYSAMLQAALRSRDSHRFYELLAEMQARGIPRTAKVELRVRQMQEALDGSHVDTRQTQEALDRNDLHARSCTEDVRHEVQSTAHMQMAQMQKPLGQNEQDLKTKPTRDAAPINSRSAPGKVESLPLPPGWCALLDPASGRYYYWMESEPLSTVTWQRPS